MLDRGSRGGKGPQTPDSVHLAQGVSRHMRRLAIAACIILSLSSSSAQAQLRGHGGPVRAMALSSDGKPAF